MTHIPCLSVRNLRLEMGSDSDDPLSMRLPSFDLNPGAVCVLYGESGVGKTTFLETLAGLRVPDEADLFQLTDLEGITHDLVELYEVGQLDAITKLRAGPIGYVPQGGGVLPFLTAQHNILLGAVGGASRNNRLNALARQLDMQAHLGKRRSALSGGQRKRVALMRGLIQPRALLLLDEPTAGLDNAMADRVLNLVLEHARKEATSVIIVMHDIERAIRCGLVALELVRKSGNVVQLRRPKQAGA